MGALLVLGVFLVVAGGMLALRPLATAQFVNRLRFAPFNRQYAREYRIAGICMAIIGALLALTGALM